MTKQHSRPGWLTHTEHTPTHMHIHTYTHCASIYLFVTTGLWTGHGRCNYYLRLLAALLLALRFPSMTVNGTVTKTSHRLSMNWLSRTSATSSAAMSSTLPPDASSASTSTAPSTPCHRRPVKQVPRLRKTPRHSQRHRQRDKRVRRKMSRAAMTLLWSHCLPCWTTASGAPSWTL